MERIDWWAIRDNWRIINNEAEDEITVIIEENIKINCFILLESKEM
jgi:hypothetical protein